MIKTQKTLKCYGIRISQAEIDTYLTDVENSMEQLNESLQAVCSFQDQEGLNQVFIYKKKELLNTAFKKGRDIGFETIEVCPTLIYVPVMYFKESLQ